VARVLVIEPDASIAATLKRLLEDAGHIVAATPVAFEGAATVVESQYPLVVIVDPRMDGSFGAEDLVHLASQGAVPGHAIVTISPVRRAQLAAELRYLLARLSIPTVRFPVDISVLRGAVTEAGYRLPERVPPPPMPGSCTHLLPHQSRHHAGLHTL
jgi:CheY-like chemotaxis protein